MSARTDHLHGRMAEHLTNWQNAKKPKPTGKRVKYDWLAKRVVREERAGHRQCFGLAGDEARRNYDRIFNK